MIWLVLIAGSAGLFFLLGRNLFRKVKILLREIGEAADRLGVITDELQVLAERSDELAVFADPSQMRQERFLAGRSREGRRPTRPGVQRVG